MQLIFGLGLACVVVHFADGSLDDPGVVTECLEENEIVPQRKLVLTDICWFETIEKHKLLSRNRG